MYCPECGTKIDEPINFCPECGTNLIGLFAEVAASQATTNAPQATPTTPTPSAQTSAPAQSAQPAQPAQPSQPAQQAQSAQPNRIENVHADLPPAAEPEPQPEPQEELPDVVIRGFLLTNLTTLSARLRTNVDTLRNIFQQFIDTKRRIGIAYQLVDAGNYEYHEHGFFSGRKRVKLDKSSPWYEYADILLDLHKAEKKAKQSETDYLFIVGGHEIVPMATLPHWGKDDPDNHDKDYDTDFLYAYPYGKDMEEKMWTGKIFTYDALFYIGRLPLVDGDEGLQDLINYFNRDLENSTGIEVEVAYAQADPNWKGVTTKSILPIIQKLKFCDYQVAPPSNGFAYDYLLLSPCITWQVKDQNCHPGLWFDRSAQFVFFNMHGSNGQKAPYYGGYALGSKSDFYWGMAPQLIAELEQPNIVFAQPCYGGRFIGYSKEHSMVLTALSANTLIFIGSSRSSYGSGDPKGGCSLDQVPKLRIGCSDITAYVFNQLILEGYPAGVAFFQARCETYRKGDSGWLDALSIGEFNLFGDPTLFCLAEDGQKAAPAYSKAALTTESEGTFITAMETVMQKSAGRPQSMLEQLREQVNNNIMTISDSIGKHLYEQYGIPKREPFFVQKVKYSNGSEELNFHYNLGENEDAKTEVIVQSSPNGDIINVTQSK